MIMGLDNRLFAVIMIGLFLVVLFLIFLFFGNFSYIQDACQERGYERYQSRLSFGFGGFIDCAEPLDESMPSTERINCNIFLRSCK